MQADLRLCSSHTPHCWKSYVAAHMYRLIDKKIITILHSKICLDPFGTFVCQERIILWLSNRYTCTTFSFALSDIIEFNVERSWIANFLFLRLQSNKNAINNNVISVAKATCVSIRNDPHRGKIIRGSYMSAHVLLILLNALEKIEKMRGLPSILSFFATSLINSIIKEHEC